MSEAAFIAGDWGTSNLRLSLCDARGTVLDSRQAPGAAASHGRFAEIFDSQTSDWRERHGNLPAVLGGMVGASFGWLEAAYLPCPAELAELPANLAKPRAGTWIVPGMRCTNPLGAPDVMRGEETQLLGACEIDATLGAGRHLVCLPGTHTKWVSLLDGIVQEFLTVPTGELFAMLCDHSVLVRDPATPVTHQPADFDRGLAESACHPEVPLPHRLFQARSLRLDGQLAAKGAASWTSGLLIGTDVGGALPLFASHALSDPVYVVGAPELSRKYLLALTRHGRTGRPVDGGQAALAGLAAVFRDRAEVKP